MKKLSILLVILAVLSALILVSCSGEENPEPGENGGGNFAGVIHHTEFLQAVNVHCPAPFVYDFLL